MGIIRQLDAPNISLPGFKIESYSTSTAYPFGISRDLKTVYGGQNETSVNLYQSTNDGSTWTLVKALPQIPTGIIETDDGEALVFCIAGDQSKSYVYKTSGWATSHTTATFNLVLTTAGGKIIPRWGGAHSWSFGNDKIRANTSKVGVVCTWGGQTSASGDQTSKGRYAYITNDFGSTWTQILDVHTHPQFNGAVGMHLHGVAYDPYWDRIWVTYGDQFAGTGTGNVAITYSDDRGVTWAKVPAPANMGTQTAQSTTIGIFKDCIIFGADPTNGMYKIARTDYRVMGELQFFLEVNGGTGNLLLSQVIHQNKNQPGAPVLAAHSSIDTSVDVALFVSIDNGQSFVQAWDDPSLKGGYKGFRAIYGPTYNGKLVGWINSNNEGTLADQRLIRGELVVPEPNMMDARIVVAGDGTTTSFSIPHNLGSKPSQVIGWSEKATSAVEITADATNVTATYATAPSAGAALTVAVRFAP